MGNVRSAEQEWEQMNGLTAEEPTFFSFIFTLWKHIEISYGTKIVPFSAISTEWAYPTKLFNKNKKNFQILIKFYQHLHQYKRKRLNKIMIKTFNWLVLGNKCEIYLFTKEVKEKRIWQYLEIFYIRMFSNRKNRKHLIWCLKSICLGFQKILPVVKLTK